MHIILYQVESVLSCNGFHFHCILFWFQTYVDLVLMSLLMSMLRDRAPAPLKLWFLIVLGNKRLDKMLHSDKHV